MRDTNTLFFNTWVKDWKTGLLRCYLKTTIASPLTCFCVPHDQEELVRQYYEAELEDFEEQESERLKEHAVREERRQRELREFKERFDVETWKHFILHSHNNLYNFKLHADDKVIYVIVKVLEVTSTYISAGYSWISHERGCGPASSSYDAESLDDVMWEILRRLYIDYLK